MRVGAYFFFLKKKSRHYLNKYYFKNELFKKHYSKNQSLKKKISVF